MAPSTLIYLHGFNSSPQALKAQQVATYLTGSALGITYLRPDIASHPGEAMRQLQDLITPLLPEVALIGSSLGGYYAAYLAETYGLWAVLVNPAVYPYRNLRNYLGPQHNPYRDEHYELTEAHIAQLQDLEVPVFSHPERIWLLLQQGDETLDYRQARDKYPDCPQRIEAGGNHQFVGFERHIPEILAFLGLNAPSSLAD